MNNGSGDMQVMHTTTSAAQQLRIPPSTLLSAERAGRIGPFARDVNGRRLLTDADLEQIRAHFATRGRRAA